MFTNRLRFISALLSITLVIGLMSACSSPTPVATTTPAVTTKAPVGTTAAPTTAAATTAALPIVSSPLTLNYWSPFNSKPAATSKDLNGVTCYQELEKRTGIHINWMHPPIGQEKEAFGLMISSGDLPDMIFYNWMTVSGGPAKYINDKVILKLNDLIDKSAPNFKAVLAKYPEAAKQSMLDDGTFFEFTFIKPDPLIRTYNGFITRKDWLDKLNLKNPVTISDWYTVLKAFKEKDPNGNGKADELPLVSVGAETVKWFTGAYGFKVKTTKNPASFYQKSGKVMFGPIQDGYKAYLTEMRKWYAEGLIDPDFAATDVTQQTAKITSNLAGTFYDGASGGMGNIMGLMKNQASFNLTAVEYPAGTDGIHYNIDQATVSTIAGDGGAITTANKHIPESIRWLDYQYGSDGFNLMNFGIEGLSYKMVNSEPIYTDLIMKNPDGLTIANAVAKYTSTYNGTFVYASGYYLQMLTLQQQKDALKIWATNADFSLNLPPIAPTSAESQEMSKIMSDIDSYVDEMFVKFVMGQVSLDTFETYRSTIKSMNIDRATQITQDALTRYNSRK